MVGNYKVITLCGSTRFKYDFERVNRELTLEGNIVISVGAFGHAGDVFTGSQKIMLDDIRKRKIDMADEIFVVNVGGYIGSSTQSEIEYALEQGKVVNYLENGKANSMKGKYTWNENPDDELWHHDRFSTIEECISDAVENYEKRPGETIAIGECEDYEPNFDVELLLDRAAEDAYEKCGEAAEGWPYFERSKGYQDADKLQERMNKVFEEWLRETGQTPTFYHILPLAELVTIPEK